MDDRKLKYERAKKKVQNLKGFYTHLFIYVIINILLQLFYAGVFDFGTFSKHFPYWVRFTTPFFWGLSLAGHAVWIFYENGTNHFLKAWEERKIKEILDKQENEGKQYN
ncbi:hypothetical protein EAX61_16035 [Dokdonia sinensis]|uniref:2TM domain-containing protein n=1 Tax=Dokdonia sinensis TaxID=2479847 RepID=A0A3M0FU99_9FLAO|nr:2TM domain-containing protein [Dokdonia sinensis]RMB56088.1 hypothetical protein EAX61_16035 [Dokdonia sinensis]